jgi:GWxTD domain-containing protein
MRDLKFIEGAAGFRKPPLILLAFLVITALSAGVVPAADQEVPRPSEGDIIFYADVVTFYGEDGRNTEEVYCVMPNEQIKFIDAAGGFKGDLRYEVLVFDMEGEEIARTEKDLEVFADTETETEERGIIQVFQSSFEVAPGRYRVQVTIEDQNAMKKAIVSYLLKKKNTGTAEIEIVSKEFERGTVAVSDIELARSLRRRSSGMFEKSGYEVTPNPSRLYGLLMNELALFFEIYDLTEEGAGDSLVTVYSILNKTGDVIFADRKTVTMSGWSVGNAVVFDISSLAAGTYLLRVEVQDGGGNTLAWTQSKFDIAWTVLSWGKYRSEIVEDMLYILTDDEMEEFRSLSTGDQEQYLTTFWQDLDPTPGTLGNEALEEHYRRVNHADMHFSTTVRGALSDMGRLYIKYGPPDDIQQHYSDYEFVQGTRDMGGGVDPVLTDPFVRTHMKAGEPGTQDYTRTAGETDELLDQRGGETVHGKSYEVWSYEGPGNPVRRLAKRAATQASVRFIFADETGNGDYRLIYSTEKHEH